LWDCGTGKPLGISLLHQGPIRAVGYSPDGKILWTAGAYGKVRLWDAATMSPLGAPIHQQSAIYTVAFSPDQRRLATGIAGGTAGQPVPGRPLAARWHGVFPGPEPGRQDDRDGVRGPQRPALGHGHGKVSGEIPGPPGFHPQSGLQPGWADGRDGEFGQDRPA